MENSQKSLKILHNPNISKGSKPIIRRAKRLRNLSDAEKLISRITSEYIKGNISAEESRNLNQLIQGFISARREAMEEKELFEYINLRFALLQWESVKSIDSLSKAIEKEFDIQPEQLNKISESYRQQFNLAMEKRKEEAEKIIESINTETNFKIKLTMKNNPEELKKLILFSLRKLNESDRYNLLDELKENFYGE